MSETGEARAAHLTYLRTIGEARTFEELDGIVRDLEEQHQAGTMTGDQVERLAGFVLKQSRVLPEARGGGPDPGPPPEVIRLRDDAAWFPAMRRPVLNCLDHRRVRGLVLDLWDPGEVVKQEGMPTTCTAKRVGLEVRCPECWRLLAVTQSAIGGGREDGQPGRAGGENGSDG